MVVLRLLIIFWTSVALVSCGQAASIADLRTGDQIVAALEKYRADHGAYPEALSELAPSYIPAITPPRYGARKWDYITYRNRSDFALFYWGSRPDQDGYCYGAPENKWEVVHNSF